MKVQITFDITDEERIVLGLQTHGSLAPATRAEMEEAIRSYVATPLDAGVEALRKANQDIINEFAGIKRVPAE